MKRLFKRYPYWFVCLLSIGLVGGYEAFWASDRYVSDANVVLESPQIAPTTFSFQSLLSGASGDSGDMLLLRDYLLSVDMLRKVDEKLHFRQHYSSPSVDLFSRLWSPDVPIEKLHDYYLKRVSVEMDDYAHILRIKVEAFTPKMAHDIAQFLIQQGEAHMNAMGQRLAEEQVRFLDKQVKQLNKAFVAARKDIIDYQNANGLVSPTSTVESISSVVANLEAQLANLKAKKIALLSYQSNHSAAVQQIDAQIKALNEQIGQERSRMAKRSGDALNSVSAEYQTLELRLKFAQESYSGALAALENTRIEAARKLKQVSILQSPTMPEYPIKPERLYNTVVFAIIALFLGLIINMLVLIIKDHRD